MTKTNFKALALALPALAVITIQPHAQPIYTPYAFTTLTDGTGGALQFRHPQAVTVDPNGNVIVANTSDNTIQKVTPQGVITTLAGLAGSSGTNDGIGSEARFYFPFGVALDGAANVYLTDTWNHTIRKITPTREVTTLAGVPGTPGANDGPRSTALFRYPAGVAVDNATNV